MRFFTTTLLALVYATSSLTSALPAGLLTLPPIIVEREITAALNDKQILACLRAMKTGTPPLSGSFGNGQWNDLHGDTKSKKECLYDTTEKKAYNIQIMKGADGKYHARVLEGAHAYESVEVPACPNGKAPFLGRAIHALRKHYGGENPPAGGC